jgi:hypothetical protein
VVSAAGSVDINKFDSCLLDSSIRLDCKLESTLNEFFCCVYTGAMGIANCMDTIIEAAWLILEKGYTDIKFILIGEGTEKNRLEEYC